MWINLIIFLIAFLVGVALTNSARVSYVKSVPARTEAISIPENHRSTGDSEVTNISSGASQGFLTAGARDEQDARDFFTRFQRAVANDDRETVALLMNYPLRANFPLDESIREYRSIRDKRSFLAVYDTLFDERLKQFVVRINPNDVTDLWGNYHGISVGRGVIWIGVFCGPSGCDGKPDIRIRTIHSNSAFLD